MEQKYSWTENDVERILDSIATMHEAGIYMIDQVKQDQSIHQMLSDVLAMLERLSLCLKEYCKELPSSCRLLNFVKDLQVTTLRIQMGEKPREWVEMKLQFEFLALLEELYQQAFYWLYATMSQENLKEYQEKAPELCSNPYISESKKTGNYPYKLSIVIIAYNKLDYTKLCVDGVLKNIPPNLSYELILFNHGSTDGTMEYFETIKPTKQIDIAINGDAAMVLHRIVEGEYFFAISNDVIITPNTIENLLACMESDSKVAWCVPVTPNISNLQAEQLKYSSVEELQMIAGQHNQKNPYQWEQRTRLCNPLSIQRADMMFAEDGILLNQYMGGDRTLIFPDDKTALLCRRRGYKMILTKDTYCHHFGSVTVKDAFRNQKREMDFYQRGREKFCELYGVDPWGTGFCYDALFLKQVVFNSRQPQTVLGINCGFGANSLKIKEQLKEYCHNLDVTLLNITDDSRYIEDLKGVSDEAELILNLSTLQQYLNGKTYDYLVWETPFLPMIPFERLNQELKKYYSGKGNILIHKTAQNETYLKKCGYMPYENDWFIEKEIPNRAKSTF